jgi:hypothetical protein
MKIVGRDIIKPVMIPGTGIVCERLADWDGLSHKGGTRLSKIQNALDAMQNK